MSYWSLRRAAERASRRSRAGPYEDGRGTLARPAPEGAAARSWTPVSREPHQATDHQRREPLAHPAPAGGRPRAGALDVPSPSRLTRPDNPTGVRVSARAHAGEPPRVGCPGTPADPRSTGQLGNSWPADGTDRSR